MRRAAKRDANENDLVGYASDLGVMWVQTGPLDGWALWREHWYPVEIKNLEGKNKYTDAQVLFLARCKERNAPVWTWRTELDVFESLGARQTA
jgi:hypothetical protein